LIFRLCRVSIPQSNSTCAKAIFESVEKITSKLIKNDFRPKGIVPIGPDNLERTTIMLFTIAVILIILWLLGLVTSYTLGGFIHLLLVIAVVVVLVRIIRGKKVL
jgi:hypothetical protein